MFSRSKRFADQADNAPAVGQYDISKGPCTHGGAVLFPKDRRFKETGATDDPSILDISNCSTASTRSTGSLNNGVFLTPRNPCSKSKARSKVAKLNQAVSNDESNKLYAKIAELEEKIRKLRAEKENLQKLYHVELSDDERQMVGPNLVAVNEELEELRKQIEDEIGRNKELVYQQNNYEFSLKTMQADLELANSQVVALQQQIDSLERMNADLTESREELECQCTALHGMNIALQKEKLVSQDRIDKIEGNWKIVCAIKEELSANLLSCRQQHELEIQAAEKSVKKKESIGDKLSEELDSYKNKIDCLKSEMNDAVKNEKETTEKLKVEKETLVLSFEKLKKEHIQAQKDMARKEEKNVEILRTCQNLQDQIVLFQQTRKVEIETLADELKQTKTTLKGSKDECEAISKTLQEIQGKYENVCQSREELQHDLNALKEDKRNVDKEILEAQGLINVLQENEHEHRTIAETLTTKLEVCTVALNHLNKMNTEYQDTIKANGRKVEDVLASLQAMAEKCESLENQFALAQQSRDAEVKKLAEELELSETTLMNREEEYVAIHKTLKEMKQSYEEVSRHRLQLEHDLQVATHEKNMLDAQLTATQKRVHSLQESEAEQTSIVEILRGEIEDLEKKNETVQTELTQHNSFRKEIKQLQDQLSNMQQENRSLAAAEEKASRLKQEFGRRLIEAQKKLSEKDMDIQNYKKDLDKMRAEYEGGDSWRRKFEELEEKIAPFQEQLDAYELEKRVLLNRNSESQSEIDKLGQQYARLLGHQNQKQKIRHVQKLKDENASLKKEVAELREEFNKEKFSRKKLEEKLSKATGTRRFDPSLAFKHATLEDKENTMRKDNP